MEIIEPVKTIVDITLESQRETSEVRAILQDLERLITVSPERRRRWVWELLQNAKDCANENGVNITITLSNEKVIFEHDGVPFSLVSILALARRTSTKPFNGDEDSTGKFGTGFVTTHILNRRVTVSGLLETENGDNPFCIDIDRTPNGLPELQQELKSFYSKINDFYNAQSSTESINTKYEYILDGTREIAIESLEEFKSHLPFTLVTNNESSKKIKSVVIIDEINSTGEYHETDPPFIIEADPGLIIESDPPLIM